MSEAIYRCAAQKKDCKAKNRDAAAKYFLCDKCLSFNKECSGPMVKNQKEDSAREALRKLALKPRARRGETKTLALLFLQEIKALVKAGYGFRSIARVLRENGYALGEYGSGLKEAFNRYYQEAD